MTIVFEALYNLVPRLYRSKDMKNTYGGVALLLKVRPRVVDVSFIATGAHQKIKASFYRINFDYTTNFIRKFFLFLYITFLLSIKKERKMHTKLDRASKFT